MAKVDPEKCNEQLLSLFSNSPPLVNKTDLKMRDEPNQYDSQPVHQPERILCYVDNFNIGVVIATKYYRFYIRSKTCDYSPTN